MIRPDKILLLAPLLFAAHIAEEVPGYVLWYNSIATRGITQESFLPGNLVPFAGTFALAILAAYTKSRWTTLLLLAWLANFMFANALYHVAASVAFARYSPGTITAVIFYLPYFAWLLSYLRSEFQFSLWTLAGVTAIGGLPWFVQGYLVVTGKV